MIRYLLALIVAACALAACSAPEDPEASPIEDSGVDAAPIVCGDDVCAPGDECKPAGPPPSSPVCVKFVADAHCADRPCGDANECSHVETDGVSGVLCRPRASLGERCHQRDPDHNPCGHDAWCSAGPGAPAPVCTVKHASGAACGEGSKTSCPRGETCQLVEGAQRCRPAKTLGQSCQLTSDCAIGLYCAADRSCATRKGEGVACSTTPEALISGECAEWLRCEDGACAPQ